LDQEPVIEKQVFHFLFAGRVEQLRQDPRTLNAYHRVGTGGFSLPVSLLHLLSHEAFEDFLSIQATNRS
jgi:hypothetical protein